MSRLRDYRPIEFKQACAIARVVFLRDPGMTTFEWKESVKDACVKQGYLPPEGDMLTRSIAAVERALEQTMGRRQVRDERPPAAKPALDGREWTAADFRALAETVKRIAARSAAAVKAPAIVVPITLAPLDISEPAAIDQFYIEAHMGDRAAALRRFAEVAIVRPPDWDFAAVRAAAAASRPASWTNECYACRKEGRSIDWHHIIQIQHGGSNYIRNRVALCEACHGDVHPWLPQVARSARDGWCRLVDIAPAARTAIARSIGKAEDIA